jgi:hypothetical protein
MVCVYVRPLRTYTYIHTAHLTHIQFLQSTITYIHTHTHTYIQLTSLAHDFSKVSQENNFGPASESPFPYIHMHIHIHTYILTYSSPRSHTISPKYLKKTTSSPHQNLLLCHPNIRLRLRLRLRPRLFTCHVRLCSLAHVHL